MKIFLWLAFALFVLLALPCMLYFGVYLARGDKRAGALALRFYRWSALVVLSTFNVAIFKHIVQTIIAWPR